MVFFSTMLSLLGTCHILQTLLCYITAVKLITNIDISLCCLLLASFTNLTITTCLFVRWLGDQVSTISHQWWGK